MAEAVIAGNAPEARVGILGGGQLAMYLCEAARRLNVHTTVLAHNEDSPAALSADRLLHGRLDDLELIETLAREVDVITFEVEEIPPETLKMLAARFEQGAVNVHPHPASMLVLQDKLLQKRWLVANGLPTNLGRPLDAETDTSVVGAWFGYPFVQKSRRGGYDGKGVQVIRGPDDGDLWPVPSVIEPFLAEVREFAVVAVRRDDGQVQCYPPVELEFDELGNVLKRVVAPAEIPARLADLASAITRRAIGRLQGAGIFAVELFLTPEGEMLVNEISPRVHNSGHHTLESCPTSQFEQHMRVITGRQPGPTRQEHPAVMVNLLSDGRMKTRPSLLADQPNVHYHWYGKLEHRPLRKMGHLTALAPSLSDARAQAESAEAAIS
jgi:5-(carboxyamino)imidazole ribonucleotide synthase